jgi:outer membrane protein assembly factor BamE (lipoprotein component of BamABCDE complex)
MKLVSTMILALTLSGCAIPGAQSVRTGESQSDVRAKLGAPAAERKLPSGDTAWFYVTGPSSFFTYRVVFGSGGTVTRYSQVLTRDEFSSLAQGATQAAVLDELGPPMEQMAFHRTATEVWTYRWLDGTFEMLADAEFAAGGNLKQIVLLRDPMFTDSVTPD